MSATEIVERACRFKEYYGKVGGITVSGGEPLLQADFVYEIFRRSKSEKINTCLDTSGSIMNDSVKRLLSVTDRVLLDIKFTKNDEYLSFVGCSIEKPIAFLEYLNECKIPTVLRQVTIPGLNSDKASIDMLKKLRSVYPCVEKIELLPFRKICKAKYEMLSIPFPFDKYHEPGRNLMAELNGYLKTE